MSFCGTHLCLQLVASLVVSLVALAGAVFLLANGGPCDASNATGIFTTVLAMWTSVPTNSKQAAAAGREAALEEIELASAVSGATDATYLSQEESSDV